MNKQYALLLLVLVGITGCTRKKNKTAKRPSKNNTELFSEVDIPVADEVIHNLLDDDVREFKIIDDADDQIAANSFDQMEEFKWIDDVAQEDTFKIVYFDFDKYTIRKDQEAALSHDINLAKRILAEAKIFAEEGTLPKIIIEGHACHSAGSRAYNLVLSEMRAKVLSDRFIAAGIPSECIKIVGRGMEIPALINGRAVEGDRAAQAPNRRDELRILYA